MGRLVVVTGPALVEGKRQRRVLLVDVATGTVRRQFDAMDAKAYFVSNDRFLLTGLGPVLYCDQAGNPVAQVELPVVVPQRPGRAGPAGLSRSPPTATDGSPAVTEARDGRPTARTDVQYGRGHSGWRPGLSSAPWTR